MMLPVDVLPMDGLRVTLPAPQVPWVIPVRRRIYEYLTSTMLICDTEGSTCSERHWHKQG